MTPELDDIQGILLRDYVRLAGAGYLLLRIEAPAAARAWLGALLPRIASARTEPTDEAVNVAFSFEGLRALGLDDRTTGLSLDFVQGMRGPRRSRILGDLGANDPQLWSWGGAQGEAPHLVLLLFARDDAAVAALLRDVRSRLAPAGLRELAALDTHQNRFGEGVKEHFGFHDGISQPAIANDTGVREGVLAPDRPENTVAPGEFVLGYRNEFGELPLSPIVPADASGALPPAADGGPGFDLGRNGSYLVFRQLEQHVARFWAWVRGAADAAPDRADAALLLAAKLFGRWPSGAPLAAYPDRDPGQYDAANDFDYAQNDPHGLITPLGSHARRANPRDSLERTGGAAASRIESNRHRLIRRGRTYGAPLDPALDPAKLLFARDDGQSRGLHFLCFNTDIDRQFQFVQSTWLLSKVLNEEDHSSDPILSNRLRGAGRFVVQAAPVRRRFQGMPAVVTVRGGAYFFLPGLNALRHLATVPV
jgi:Dyp-type peroxidase family